MARKNIQTRLCEALVAEGLAERIPSPSRKFRAFPRIEPERDGWFYFVGPSGALRTGRNVTDSLSVSGTRRHRELLESVPE